MVNYRSYFIKDQRGSVKEISFKRKGIRRFVQNQAFASDDGEVFLFLPGEDK